jgi:cation transport ATPase-like protein
MSGEYWALDVEELVRRAGSTADGLTSAEAAERLRAHGLNDLGEHQPLSRAGVMLRQLRSPLLLLLVFAAAASAFPGEWIDSGIVLAIVVATVGIGYSREYSAQAAAAALQARVRVSASVMRDGHPVPVPLEQVVPGDSRAAGRRQPRPGRRRDPGGDRLFHQRSRADRRELPGREEAGQRPGLGGPRRPQERWGTSSDSWAMGSTMRPQCTRPTPACRCSRVDVARAAADFVLLEPDLDVIRQGIEEGRKTFANTMKYILITTSANLGNMVSMAAAIAVPAVSAADGRADPPQQFPVGHPGDRDCGRQRRSRAREPAAAVGHRVHRPFHGDVRAGELRLRPAHLRRAARRLPGGAGDVPYELVRGIAAHRAGHCAGDARPAAVLPQPARHAACSRRPSASSRSRSSFRICRLPASSALCRCRRRCSRRSP